MDRRLAGAVEHPAALVAGSVAIREPRLMMLPRPCSIITLASTARLQW